MSVSENQLDKGLSTRECVAAEIARAADCSRVTQKAVESDLWCLSESQRGELLRNKSSRQGMHDLVLHSAAMQWMRVTNDGTASWLTFARRLEQTLEGARWSIDKQRFDVRYFAHRRSGVRF